MQENRMFHLAMAVAFLAAGAVALLGWVTQPAVPTPSAVLNPPPAQVEQILHDNSLNLNTATALQLEELPGIGEVLSQRILDYRRDINGFTAKEQLLEVEGIGPTTYEGIQPFVYVEEP